MSLKRSLLNPHLLLIIFFFPCCTTGLHNQLNSQKQAIEALSQRTQSMEAESYQTRKLQAAAQTEIDAIKRDIQFLKGSLEEESYSTEKRISDIESRLGMLASLYEENKIKTEADNEPEAHTVSQEKQLYDSALEAYNNGDIEKARKLFDRFITDFPQSSLAGNAVFWTGVSYYRQKNYEKAISYFDELIKKYPANTKVAEAYFFQGLSFIEIDEKVTGQIILETLIQQYPDSPQTQAAKKTIEELSK